MCAPSLISSEPLVDLRSLTSTRGAVATVSYVYSQMQKNGERAVTTQTTVLPSRVLDKMPNSRVSTSSTVHSCAADLRSRQDGVCSLASVTPSSCTTTDDRARQQQCTTQMHPTLSADSGVDVDCLESCCSCADIDDVFTDDEDYFDDLDDGWTISAHDVSLEKVINRTSCETVYR